MSIRLVATIAVGVFVVTGSPGFAAVSGEAKCKETKAKTTGKKVADILKAFGKNIKKPNVAKLAQDVSKAESKFTKGFNKAESRGECQTTGDADAIESKVNALVTEAIAELAPSCGDNIQASVEECDGTDDDACPGKCIAPGAGGGCGDNVVNGGDECTCRTEDCDGTDSAACTGLCQPDCTCPPPVCGNQVLEEGEECDGTNVSSCPSPSAPWDPLPEETASCVDCQCCGLYICTQLPCCDPTDSCITVPASDHCVP